MSTGNLYIVATPIGNLQDITLRALDTLKQVDLIAAEDKRHSSKLLQHFGIGTPLTALHEHNEEARIAYLLQKLKQGESVALISDAGTPLISDPGYQLVRAARAAGIHVSPVPGPSALTAALCSAGLASDAFVFAGFLPAKPASRLKKLESFQDEQRTMIFYEAPHRIVETIADMQQVFSADRQAVIARELTKTHETFLADTLGNLIRQVEEDPNQQRGEFVILLEGVDRKATSEDDEISMKAEEVLHILLDELPLKQASSLAAKITGLKKNALYQLGLKQKENQQ
jgi:16S rRNA (cytidine1402-2'-O)-methyltransferase